MGEAAEQTIRREIQEELALYFLIRFPPNSTPTTQHAFESTDGDTRLQFQWFPVHEQTLRSLPLFPIRRRSRSD